MEKVVYILGSGFSSPAGVPTQGAIIRNILGFEKNYKGYRNDETQKWVAQFKDFLLNVLYIREDQLENVSLEDIFTPIDRCIHDRISFQSKTVNELIKLREKFYKLIVLALRETSDKGSSEYLQQFVRHIINMAKKRRSDITKDSVSIITTNWDILLDNALQQAIDNISKKKEIAGVVDYCCYINPLDENDPKIIPALFALAKNKFNVKLLKLHGSLNWLLCPKCQRVYVKFYKKYKGGHVFHSKHCIHCAGNFKQTPSSDIKLSTNLLMPTFLKDYNNFQIKLIWQNAGIELSEATKVVFIGYSLPMADFEFRQLLSRMIPKNSKIEVVLTENDNPENHLDAPYLFAGYRYQIFFSGRTREIYYNGVCEYVEKYLKS
jgi:NAD-dependent SIR2 family protein deacetylase